MKALLLIPLVALLVGCSDPSTAQRLKDQDAHAKQVQATAMHKLCGGC